MCAGLYGHPVLLPVVPHWLNLAVTMIKN